MKHTTGTLTTPDGTKLFTQRWQRDLPVTGVLMLIHGLGEHGGRYVEFADFFTKKGIVVTTFDLRGHGKSEGIRGHIPSYDTILDDIELFFHQEQKLFPDMPHYLYGHSLGGNFLINLLLQREIRPTAAIASAPALRTAFTPPKWKLLLAKSLRFAWPHLTMHNGLKGDDLTRSISTEKYYEKDPLVHSQISIELALSGISQGLWAIDNAGRLSVPTYIIHSKSDRITDAKASTAFIAGSDSKYAKIKLYDEMFHELHNEPERDMILEDVYAWMQEVNH